MVRVLFVCTGNICRSPTAEGVFRRQVEEAGLSRRISVASAGTHGYHIGQPPDPRSRAAAAVRKYDLNRQRARELQEADFIEFDHLLAMDRDHLAIMQRMCPQDLRQKVELFLSYGSGLDRHEVPDPYYGGKDGFELVLDLVENASRGLLDHIRRHLVIRN